MSNEDKSVTPINIESVIKAACKLPYCRINRIEFLTAQLSNKIPKEQLLDALENGTINAQVPMKILNSVADGAVKLETSKVTLISATAGLPGGFAMFATIPADLAQFYAHIFRVAQKLAYIYGYKEINFDDETHNVLIIFLGAMFGVKVAVNALAKFAADNAVKIGARIAGKPLSRYAIYNISKMVLKWISVNVTKAGVGKAISKSVPFVGAALSGCVTVAIFLPMSRKLKRELRKFANISPEDLESAYTIAENELAEFDINPNEYVLRNKELKELEEHISAE